LDVGGADTKGELHLRWQKCLSWPHFRTRSDYEIACQTSVF